MAILVIFRLEERIAQRNRLNALHIRIRDKLRINVEKHRHIHRFARIQPLLLEAKALDLAKVRRHLSWRDRVCCDPDDVFVGLVRRGVERQRGFAGQNAHFALLRDKLPGQDVRHRAIERYTDPRVILHRLQALGRVAIQVSAAVCR